MVRRKTAPSITPKMYRNFAIATVAITGSVAMIADSDKREAVASQIETAEAYAQRPKNSEPVLKMSEEVQQGSGDLDGFYRDTGGGGPSDAGDGLGSVVPLELRAYASGPTAAQLAQLGLSRAKYDSLSDAEKKQIMEMLTGISYAERQRNIAKATAASARRAGQDSESADY